MCARFTDPSPFVSSSSSPPCECASMRAGLKGRERGSWPGVGAAAPLPPDPGPVALLNEEYIHHTQHQMFEY